jgi:hypothetical protein
VEALEMSLDDHVAGEARENAAPAADETRGATHTDREETRPTRDDEEASPSDDEESDDELRLNHLLGAALKNIASEKRRRDQRSEEIRPERGMRVSWRRALRTYVIPSSRRGYVDSWLVARDHWE